MELLPFGFADKSIKRHLYRYFWFYNGQGHKTEVYLGRADAADITKRCANAKLEYLLNVQKDLETVVLAARQELANLST